jgi:hypothetical protein
MFSYQTLGKDLEKIAISQCVGVDTAALDQQSGGDNIRELLLAADRASGEKRVMKTSGLLDHFDAPQKDVMGYFDYSNNHVFPNNQTIAKFAARMSLDLWRTIALILKANWEKETANASPLYDTSNEDSKLLLEILDRAAKENGQTGRIPESSIIESYQSIKSNCPHLSVMPQDRFIAHATEMILNRLHILPNDSVELSAFVGNMDNELESLFKAQARLQEEFWFRKMQWLRLNEQLMELLYEIEGRQVENENTRAQWMARFGKEFIRMQELSEWVNNLRFKIQLKELNPEMSLEQINQKALKRERESELKIKRMEAISKMPPNIYPQDWMQPADLDLMAREERHAKKILRKIWTLVHPDRLEKDPAYKKLTEKQKKTIEDLREEAQRIKVSELGYMPDQVGWNRRSIVTLAQILRKTEKILENAGVDLDADLMVQGGTVEERLESLKRDIERLEIGVQEAQSRLTKVTDDPDVREQRFHLSCPEQHDQIKAGLKEQAGKYGREAEELERRLKGLF